MIPALPYRVCAGLKVLASSASHKMWKTLAGGAWPVPATRDAGANGLRTFCLAERAFRRLCGDLHRFHLGLVHNEIKGWEKDCLRCIFSLKSGCASDRAYQYRCGQIRRKSIFMPCTARWRLGQRGERGRGRCAAFAREIPPKGPSSQLPWALLTGPCTAEIQLSDVSDSARSFCWVSL